MTTKRTKRSTARFLALLALQLGLLALAGCGEGPATDGGAPGPGNDKVMPAVHVVGAVSTAPGAPPAEAVNGPEAAAEPMAANLGTAPSTDERMQDGTDEARDGTGEVPACAAGVDHRRAGREAWLAGDRETAARELRCAVEDGSGDGYDTYLLGLALWKTGELDGAAAALSAAAWQLDDPVRAYVNLARVRIELGDLPGARQAVREALDRDADDADAWNVLGRVLLGSGDRDGAAEAFARAAELDPENPWPRTNLGYLFLVSGEPERALAPLEEAVAIDAGLAPAWHDLALARERAGDLPGALAAARRAAGLAGDGRYASTAERIAALLPASREDEETAVAATPAPAADATAVAAAAGDGSIAPVESLPLHRSP